MADRGPELFRPFEERRWQRGANDDDIDVPCLGGQRGGVQGGGDNQFTGTSQHGGGARV